MAHTLLRAGLYFIGCAGVLIGVSFYFLGVEYTGQIFNRILSLLYDAGPITDLGTPNAETELRFFSVFWMAYGVILIQTARELTQHARRVPLLLGLFFLGGVGRTISYVADGPPHALFVLLMIIELVLPILLWLCFWRWRKSAAFDPA